MCSVNIYIVRLSILIFQINHEIIKSTKYNMMVDN